MGPGPYTGATGGNVVAGDASTPGVAGGPGAGGAAVGGTAGGATLGGTAGGATTGGAATGGAALGGAPPGGGAPGGAGATPGAGLPDAGGAVPGGGGSTQTPQDAGPTPVLTLPTVSVACGASPCDGLNKVCCESWTEAMSFSAQPMCATREACRQAYPFDLFNPNANRVVTHTCDGKEDCSSGQICCFYAEGRPLCDAPLDPAACLANITGPGSSRICTEESKCKQGSLEFIAEGLPLGVLSCNDDSDCQARPGTSCQPEQDNSLTTGKGIRARPHVKVCR